MKERDEGSDFSIPLVLVNIGLGAVILGGADFNKDNALVNCDKGRTGAELNIDLSQGTNLSFLGIDGNKDISITTSDGKILTIDFKGNSANKRVISPGGDSYSVSSIDLNIGQMVQFEDNGAEFEIQDNMPKGVNIIAYCNSKA